MPAHSHLLGAYAGELVASCVGGSAGMLVGAPLDYLKSHQQNARLGASSTALALKALRQAGVPGLFKGGGPPLVGGLLYQVSAFPTYKFCLSALPDRHGLGSMVLAGTGAGLVSTLFTTPCELVKVKLQLDPGARGGTHGAARREIARLYRLGGPRALFTGWTAMAVREGPGSGLYFGLYHYGKEHAQARGLFSPRTSEFLSGGVSGVLCWVCVLPADVCKTRLQMDAYARDGAPRKYRGLWHWCVRRGRPAGERGTNVARGAAVRAAAPRPCAAPRA
jgi:solute carrier family 25 carnitine/acylcarnitine transporter 20/29